MYWTMLRRELSGRKRQTIIVAAGLAVAIALVIVVSALSAGVRDAQARALESVYGVGTDLTVTAAPQEPGQGGMPRFEFGQADGQTSDGTTTLDQSRLTSAPGRGTIDASAVDTVAGIDGVAAATGVLSLTNTTFTGEIPDFSQMDDGSGAPGGMAGPPQGGPDGQGGSAFGIDSFSVLGIDPAASGVGPLSATELVDGRALEAADATASVALVDETYANGLAVGDALDVGGEEVEIVGVVASATDAADTAADVYLPIGTARSLAGIDDAVSTVYVSAESASAIDAVQAEIEAALPDATVSSQAQLAEQVSGSLSSASALIAGLGTWLSIAVLAVALLIAVLLTSSGVARRTREFGTLKAIGWSNGRVVSQLAGESMVQALIGGAAGLVLGLGAVGIVNLIAPTIGGGTAAAGAGGLGQAAGAVGPGGGGMPGGEGMPDFGGAPGGLGQTSASVGEIVLNAPVTPWIVLAAIALAVLGGVLAGAFGGWRAARLSPVEALRSVG
jgi:ABC-type antimicrobial peptide transport system permease subunit